MNKEEKLKLIRCSQKRRIPVLLEMLEDGMLPITDVDLNETEWHE
jgi:hypothetical protein